MSKPSWPLQKAIAEACGIPTEGLIGMVFDDSDPETNGTITTQHIVMPPVFEDGAFKVLTQVWTPQEVTDADVPGGDSDSG